MDKPAYTQGYGDLLKVAFRIKVPHAVKKWVLKHPVKAFVGSGALTTAGMFAIPPTLKYPQKPQEQRNEILDNAAAALKHLYIDGPNSKATALGTTGLLAAVPLAVAGYKAVQERKRRQELLRRRLMSMGVGMGYMP